MGDYEKENKDELFHSGTFEINSSQHVNFNVKSSTTKPYDLELMTGKKQNNGGDKK